MWKVRSNSQVCIGYSHSSWSWYIEKTLHNKCLNDGGARWSLICQYTPKQQTRWGSSFKSETQASSSPVWISIPLARLIVLMAVLTSTTSVQSLNRLIGSNLFLAIWQRYVWLIIGYLMQRGKRISSIPSDIASDWESWFSAYSVWLLDWDNELFDCNVCVVARSASICLRKLAILASIWSCLALSLCAQRLTNSVDFEWEVSGILRVSGISWVLLVLVWKGTVARWVQLNSWDGRCEQRAAKSGGL